MKEAIIIFTRVPVPGNTKTRLQKLLRPEECAKLHVCFLKDLKSCCDQLGKDYFVFYTPEGEKARLVQILGEMIPYFLQQGDDIGVKMYHAISCVFRMGYEACILIGADIPEVKAEDLQAAFAVLEDKDVVLGPTADQGYYLVGMKKPHREVFENQTYGYGSVLKNTIEAIRAAGLTYGLIPVHEDIDEPEDIFRYHDRSKKKDRSNKSNTAEYVAELIGNTLNEF